LIPARRLKATPPGGAGGREPTSLMNQRGITMPGGSVKSIRGAARAVFALALLAGCASTEVTERQILVGDDKIARPERIIVYDFSATLADVPTNSAIAGQVDEHSAPQSAAEIEVGRKLGAQVAQDLAAEIQKMGLPAVTASGQQPPRPGDVVIKGHLVSIDEGSAAQRVLIGFGSGAAELKTVVEGYLVTEQGLQPLGSRKLEVGGNELPGVLVPAAVLVATANPIGLVVGGAAKVAGEATGSNTLEGTAERTAEKIAEELRPAFEKQGWIAAG
jgi:hypothetical protein